MFKQSPVLFIVLAVLSGLFGVWYLQPSKVLVVDTETAKESPTLFARSVTRQVFTDEGELSSIIHAKELLQRDPSEAAKALTPDITLYRDGKASWYITSETALLNPDGTTTLINDVKIQQAKEAEENWLLVTPELSFHAERQYAYTEHPVTMTRIGGRLDAVGMEMDLKKETVEFKANVSAVYQMYNPQDQD